MSGGVLDEILPTSSSDVVRMTDWGGGGVLRERRRVGLSGFGRGGEGWHKRPALHRMVVGWMDGARLGGAGRKSARLGMRPLQVAAEG